MREKKYEYETFPANEQWLKEELNSHGQRGWRLVSAMFLYKNADGVNEYMLVFEREI
jgi:hypothetical protein